MKYWIKTSIAAALAAGLIGLYFLDDKLSQQKKDAEKVETSALQFEQNLVRKIRLRSAGGVLVFERENAASDWKFSDPAVKIKLEQTAVSNFLSTLNGVSSSMEIADTEKVLHGGDKSPFGLQKPVTTVEVTLEDKSTKTLDIGSDMEIGSRTSGKFEAQAVYAANNVRKSIFVISKPAVAFLKKSFSDFRTKNAVELNIAEVKSFSVTSNEVPTTPHSAAAKASESTLKIIVAKTDSNWSVKSPRDLPADQNNVSTYLNSVAKLRVEKVTEKEMLNPDRMAAFGLDKPAGVVEFIGADGKSLVTVRLGKVKDGYFVEMADGAIGSLNANTWAEVVPELKYFRDKRVMRDVKMSEVSKMRTASGKVFQKEGANWYETGLPTLADKGKIDAKSAVSPTPNVPGKVTNTEAGTLFSTWEFLSAEDVVDSPEAKDMALYGLNKPSGRLVFEFADAKVPPEEILVGNKVPKDSKLVYVKRANRAAVFLVNADWLENLAKLDGAKMQNTK